MSDPKKDDLRDPAVRLALERQLNADAHRLEVHAAKMELLRFTEEFQHLDELRTSFWSVIEAAIALLTDAESAP